MAVILNNKKSTNGSPYAYYTVKVTTSNRTATTIDLTIEINSNLAASSSLLGTGSTMGLTGYLKLLNTTYSLPLKTTIENWSGTTVHTKTYKKTLEVDGPVTKISGIQFRVMRSNNSTSAGAYLAWTDCSDITFEAGHTPPDNITYTMIEKNQKLIESGIPNNVIVENLSIKEFDISYELHDDATVTQVGIYNRTIPYFTSSNPFLIDFSNYTLNKWPTDSTIPIVAAVRDSMGYQGISSPINESDLYDCITYTKLNIIETITNVKRNGQISGKAKLNISGNYHNKILGNVDQTNYKPIIKYKYWKYGDAEPTTFDNVISSDNITISNGTFNVENLEIGSSTETDVNYFNPDNAYRLKIYVEDNFTSYISNEKSIPVGKATWTEYKDRVDFEKITIKNKNIFAPRVGDIVITSTNVSPAEDYGGSWELIDKEFTPKRLSGASLFTNNSTNVSSSSMYLVMGGHTITLEIGFNTKVSYGDTTLQVGQYNLNNIGIKAFNSSLDFVGFTDGGNCALFLNVTTAGVLGSYDVIPDATVASGRLVEATVTFTITSDNMLDSACNKFYWKKTE